MTHFGGLRRMLRLAVVGLLAAVALPFSLPSAHAELLTSNQYQTCENTTVMPISSFSYTYDVEAVQLDLSLSGTLADKAMGFFGNDWTTMYLTLDALGISKEVRVDRMCVLFNECPAADGYVPQGTAWKLNKSISLPMLIPWVDYNVTFRVRPADRSASYACAKFSLSQASAAYIPIPGYVTAALPPLALVTGLLDTLLSPERSFFTFLLGDGSPYRLPGFFDMWEHAQWVSMTGMLGAHYPAVFENFVGAFGWSFFDWRIGFIDSLAGDSVIARQEAASGASNDPVKAAAVPDAAGLLGETSAAPVTLRRRATKPACSATNAGPNGECAAAGQCCSKWGSCGVGPEYCGEGGGPPFDPNAASTPSATPKPTGDDKSQSGASPKTADGVRASANTDGGQVYSFASSGIAAYARAVRTWADRLVHVTFYTYLLAMLIGVVVVGLASLFYWQLSRHRGVSAKAWPSMDVVGNAVMGIFLRITLLAYLPLLLTSVHHMALPQASSFGAGGMVISCIVFTVLICGPFYLLYLIFSCHSPTALFDNADYLFRFGTIYNTFTAGRVRYAVVPFMRRIVYAVIIGGGQRSGIAQIVCLLVMEAGLVLVEFWLVPRSVHFGNQLAAVSGMLRFLGWLFVIPLLPSVDLGFQSRQACGFAFAIAHLLLIALWVVLLIRSLAKVLVAYRGRRSFSDPTPMSGRQTVLVRRHHDVEANSSVAAPRTVPEPVLTEHEWPIRDRADSFDRYQPPPSGRFSSINRLSGTTSSFITGMDPSGSSTYSAEAPGHRRQQSQGYTVESPRQARRHSDADFLREPRRGTPLANESGSGGGGATPSSFASLTARDRAETPRTGTLLLGATTDPDSDQADGAGYNEELFYYGGDVTGMADDMDAPPSAGGSSSANQPRLIPAFLRQMDATDSSGDEAGSPVQATFPRYMRRAETANRS
ncbi:hypothetical protein THASP1DRAFT_25354 [Thamnocephalis sphaerospora]|uniref:Chitin-binding type-1 domain-containing protein n=1 Tax=Thamnocephalis sphaerospora TaxID=78915 RepID=A0A4P9XKG0_9FUNG|nr:hypothetical protein THASP1DRAFT_32737 [Thamnocephalis sphaerospora]RKP06294.1 hypothetical protein THASP1DRAFT_25354 [Thamnocephalis sphaerospora]|eukprot:RKP05422.1 hypothetical protein THASP1DRAFT_32737 [Thamnocephalis sphaerospora]